jgi:hypothetical protein
MRHRIFARLRTGNTLYLAQGCPLFEVDNAQIVHQQRCEDRECPSQDEFEGFQSTNKVRN